MNDHETEKVELVYGVAIYRLKNTNIRPYLGGKTKKYLKMKKIY